MFVRFHSLLLIGILLGSLLQQTAVAESSYSKNDGYPVFTSLDPHTFLQTFERFTLKGWVPFRHYQEWFQFSVSPFSQNADHGQNDRKDTVPLGDLNGPWNLITMLFGSTPQGQFFSPTLLSARQQLFPTVDDGTPINDQQYNDITTDVQNRQFGVLSIDLEYRKRGCRFDFNALILSDVGINLHTGIADISQTTSFIRPLTTVRPATLCNPLAIADKVRCLLVEELDNIAEELCIDLCDFHKISMEDIHINLWWRHAFVINQHVPQIIWPHFLLIPFIVLEGSIATSREKKPNEPFSLPFDNNGHHSIGANFGLNFDFFETIEVGAQIGFTHFFKKGVNNYSVPTSELQSGIFPFRADVTVQPGNNWVFGLKMNAYHFLDHLSFWGQYIMLHHERDKICLNCPDAAFRPDLLECHSDWTTAMANFGLNYDLSVNTSAGFFLQAPLCVERNYYHSTTIMLTFTATF